jgi:hypothetical protein
MIELLQSLPLEINFRQAQNTYYIIAKTTFKELLLRARAGDENAVSWTDSFKHLGQMLFFNIAAVLQED